MGWRTCIHAGHTCMHHDCGRLSVQFECDYCSMPATFVRHMHVLATCHFQSLSITWACESIRSVCLTILMSCSIVVP